MMDKRGMRGALKAFSLFTSLSMVFLTAVPADLSAQMDQGSGAGSVGAVIVEDVSIDETEAPQIMPSPGNVTVNFKNVEIKTVLHYLSEVSGVDIIPAPGVEANVTMRLRDKPWETALDIVTRNYGYVYSREGNIIRIMPKGQLAAEETVTEVISLNNLTREIELKKDIGKKTDEVTVEQKEESIQQLMSAINSMLDAKRGEKATFISSVNAIVITAIPSKLSDIKRMVAVVDKRTAQVILDAKVVEITLNDTEQFGIDWNAVITAAGARRPITFPFKNDGTLPGLPGGAQRTFYPNTSLQGAAAFNDNIPQGFPSFDVGSLIANTGAVVSNPFFAYGTLDFSTFTATLRMLEQRGNTEILSAPRITTLDNQKATIKVVTKLMLQKSVASTFTDNTVTVEFEEEQDAREAGIKLAVIPHVNSYGEISVNLLPEVSTNEGFTLLPVGLAGTNTYSLTFSSREANTLVRVNDGETIFMGGLIRKNITKQNNKLPILGDLLGGVPLLGSVFKYDEEVTTRTEIAFFVTVHIVKDAKKSIELMKAMNLYDQYVADEMDQDAVKESVRAPVIKQGMLTETVNTEKIIVDPLAQAADKKKSFFDFRKK
jgi:type IV pilus secretin PilQ/predicted competence protein